MGSHQLPLLVSLDLKGIVLENEGKLSCTNGALWNKVNITRERGVVVKNKRSPRRRVLKKRGTRLQSSRRRNNGIQRRVKTLKRLIPNSDSSMGLDGLFSETADYILSLQSRVRLMQIMVQALTAGSEDHE